MFFGKKKEYAFKLKVVFRHPESAQKAALKKYALKFGFIKPIEKGIVDEGRVYFILGFDDVTKMNKFWTKKIPFLEAELKASIGIMISSLNSLPSKGFKRKAKALKEWKELVDKDNDWVIASEVKNG